MGKKSPAFQFYPADWLASRKIKLMSNAERGVYIQLLAHCWLDGGLPGDIESLARLADEPFESFSGMWRRLEECFHFSGGKLHNKRLILEAKKQRRFSDKQRRNARKLWGLPSKPWHSQKEDLAKPNECFMFSSSSSSSSVKLLKNKKKVENLEIPEDLKPIEADIMNWLAYKREKRQTYTPIGINALWAAIRKIPVEKRKESIDASMANNYAGIFPAKGEFDGKAQSRVPTIPGKYSNLGG